MGVRETIGRKPADPNVLLADHRTAEQRREDDEKATVWAFVWTLFAFKVITIIATFWAAAGSLDAAIVLMATNWVFLIVPMVAIWGPIAFHYRKRRARRRRAEMLRSEWMLD
jgi:hypothetical protein